MRYQHDRPVFPIKVAGRATSVAQERLTQLFTAGRLYIREVHYGKNQFEQMQNIAKPLLQTSKVPDEIIVNIFAEICTSTMAAHYCVEKLHLVAAKVIRRLAEQRIPYLGGRSTSRNVVDELKKRILKGRMCC